MKNPEVLIIIKLLRNLAVSMEVGYYFFSFFLMLDTLYSRVAILQTPYIFSIITKNRSTNGDSLSDKIMGNPTRYVETLKYPVPNVDQLIIEKI